MKLAFLSAILFSQMSFACTADEAVQELREQLLDKVGRCQVLDVSELKTDWTGHNYYSVRFSCVNDDWDSRVRRVYIDPKTGACRYDYYAPLSSLNSNN
jgi:hypothetical protein